MNKIFSNLLFIILVTTFLQEVVWSFFIPLWHFPDEQEHFTHVACNAETGKPCSKLAPKEGNLNREIYTSLGLLGVHRDENGNNNFTYHPEYNVKYSSGLTGIYENVIAQQSVIARKEFLKHDMADYPELFYDISMIPYKILYNSDLFIRVYIVRIFWLWCLPVIVYCTFKLSQLVFPKKALLTFTAATLTAFHPMISFVCAGITSDNFFNALFSLVILESAFILKYGIKLRFLIFLLALCILGFMTKPQFYVVLGIIIPVLTWRIITDIKKRNIREMQTLFLFSLIITIVGFIKIDLVKNFIDNGLNYFFFKKSNAPYQHGFFSYLFWTLKHTLQEVLPWYWGNFRWLSLVLPRWVNRVLMRILLVSFIGIIYKLILLFKKKEFNQEKQLFLFLLYSVFLYFAVLFVWDWNFIRSHGYSFGIQGRYYFPVIVPQMIILSTGIAYFAELIGKTFHLFGLKTKIYKYVIYALLLLSLWFIALQLIAFFWVTASYYDLSNFNTYIIQASQYKPWFAKGNYLIAVLSIYFLSLIFFIFRLCKFFLKNRNEN